MTPPCAPRRGPPGGPRSWPSNPEGALPKRGRRGGAPSQRGWRGCGGCAPGARGGRAPAWVAPWSWPRPCGCVQERTTLAGDGGPGHWSPRSYSSWPTAPTTGLLGLQAAPRRPRSGRGRHPMISGCRHSPPRTSSAAAFGGTSAFVCYTSMPRRTRGQPAAWSPGARRSSTSPQQPRAPWGPCVPRREGVSSRLAP